MTPSHRSSNRARSVFPRALAATALFVLAASCGKRRLSAPQAEFIIAAGDSTFWVRSDASGIRLRGSPMVLARLDGRFRELYVVDDDRSYDNALFVSQRLYQRDLAAGDSVEVFRDTLIPALTERYVRFHPDARRLAPGEEPPEEPAVSATADVAMLSVHGPFLSIDYHVDTSGVDDIWHTTRHAVIDLRTGRQVTLAEIFGPTEADVAIARGRKLYRETVDSIRRDVRPLARRAARALEHFRFDPTSFSLTAPNASLMIAFSAPGQGHGGEGFVLPLRPIAVTQPAWWSDERAALPSSMKGRDEWWSRGSYAVKAEYDTTARPVHLSLVDSSGHVFRVGGITAPVHRIYWLDRPPVDRAQRTALAKAFDEAALYNDAARAQLPPRASNHLFAARR